MGYTYVFGPVTSGRLGLSLGLDLLGEAICSLDCIYCEVGRTTRLTMRRKPYVPANDVLDELARWKDEDGRTPDFVTLGGRGEPSLNSDMGSIIEGAKKIFPDTPVAVLTNSTLLHDAQVRSEMARADVVLPSIDTLVPEEMRRLNRPHSDIDIASLTRGLLDFRAEFAGRIFLEVLLVKDVNDSDENRSLLREFIAQLRPDRVDVVTMTRPGTLRAASPVSPEVLALWRKDLAEAASHGQAARLTESHRGIHDISTDAAEEAPRKGRDLPIRTVQELVLGSVSRRPQTARQLATALDLSLDSVTQALDALKQEGRIFVETDGDDPFYKA
ncbi:wyosine [tRNA(Phe)-imidazoG37] synthetase (radical SAM superfamily) [Desulfobaculum xiamenense]|uniref:Wyosine [tRNA(Phe)-imidazoG37] synthetase (Radical SAM superfamily) n=1 Tax=Desulfobaculum xiamenense TaxID=995050 RepID=A0A846QTZ5_9BACT|nr:radical SAM protein [Desulfobaculum xiamenense]NJB68634.1 wyosine [tRNA(Phe)-imidazoG37] synthetase (radical SAM superfamily) [Desulfobaculum xiamenense]